MTNLPPSPPPGPDAGPPPLSSGSPPPFAHAPAPPLLHANWAPPPAPPKRSRVLPVILVVLLALSAVANLVLLVVLVAAFSSFGGAGYEETFLERTVVKSPSSAKIAVIRVDGIIDESLAQSLRGQMERAARDAAVKAVILRIDSPGGGLTASDMIHNDVRTILKDKPVVAAMDGVAASGGYYVACGAQEIVAQQTTVTGSIGVIAQFFFLNGLLKDKLGVVPVTLKVGEQKDWGSMFGTEMTPAQAEYFVTTLLQPGYDRFVDVVAEARKLPRDEVVRLATGRIFMAKEAKAKKLIDRIGYFEDAVEVAKQKAGLSEARVVEYIQPFRLLDLLGVQSKAKTNLLVDFTPEKLAALGSPRVMYLWTGF